MAWDRAQVVADRTKYRVGRMRAYKRIGKLEEAIVDRLKREPRQLSDDDVLARRKK